MKYKAKWIFNTKTHGSYHGTAENEVKHAGEAIQEIRQHIIKEQFKDHEGKLTITDLEIT